VRMPDVHRLEETYRQMTDAEILKLAADPDSLTEESKEALKAELYRRHLEEATAPSLPAPTEAAGLETPELRELEETYRQMADAEILRLATEIDSLGDQAADVLYAEVCRRKLEETVAGQGAEVAPPVETEDLVPRSADNDSLRYAGFWPRFGALLLDVLIMLPLGAFTVWGSGRYRFFSLYYLFPNALFGLFYGVYLVRRFGGTPGKLIMGVRIRKLHGEPVGYREAFLRYFPEFFLGLLTSAALIFPLFQITDAEYHALAFMERSRRIVQLAPPWYEPLRIVQAVWFWGELIVLLTNRKRRALHDFIAGTVVIYDSPK
jgi:uncharacterized RDD family membrane protein YckC